MTDTPTPPDRNLLSHWTPWIVVLVLVAGGAGVVGLVSATRKPREPARLDKVFEYDVERYKVIPPEKIGWREVEHFETGLVSAAALAVGPEGRIVTAGDAEVQVRDAGGKLLTTIPLPEAPCALTVSPAGDLLVATANRVGRCAFEAPIEWLATVPGERARITSVAADRDSLYVADAGARAVWRFTLDGKPMGRIGDRDPDRDIPGFNVPSPWFDLLVAPDGLLRVVDPGRHRICAFTENGDLELTWGEPTFELTGFSGCCNPSHLAMLPDGRFVTSEKGIPRVKVHDVDGTFLTAVVGSDGLDTEMLPCDVAVDPKGRIVVLDPGKAVVRIFAPKEEAGRGD